MYVGKSVDHWFFKRLLMFPQLAKEFRELRDVYFRYDIHKTYPKVY